MSGNTTGNAATAYACIDTAAGEKVFLSPCATGSFEPEQLEGMLTGLDAKRFVDAVTRSSPGIKCSVEQLDYHGGTDQAFIFLQSYKDNATEPAKQELEKAEKMLIDRSYACIRNEGAGKPAFTYLIADPTGTFVAQDMKGELSGFNPERFLEAVTSSNTGVRCSFQNQQYQGNLSEALQFIDTWSGRSNGMVRDSLYQARSLLLGLGAKTYDEIGAISKEKNQQEANIRGLKKPEAYKAIR